MKIQGTTAMLALMVVAGVSPGFCRGRSGALGASQPTITLRVVNEAGVGDRTLLLAEKEAAAMLHQAGIEVAWLACDAGRADWMNHNACQRERGPAEFWLRIVAHKPKATTDDVLGFTELDEASDHRSAGVYYPAALEAVKHGPAEVFQILGAAIAHEVGHLILGANVHSAWGVMAPHWGPDQFRLISVRELSFNSEQAKMLRDELTRRQPASFEISL